MKKIGIVLSVAIAALFQAIGVNAAGLNYDIVMKYTDNIVIFEGTTVPDDSISIEVIPGNADAANLWQSITGKTNLSDGVTVAYDTDKITFADYVTADTNGKFSVSATISEYLESGYRLLIYSEEDDKVYEKIFEFADKDSYKSVIDYLNGFIDNDDKPSFKTNLDAVKNPMGFNKEAYSEVAFDSIAEMMFDTLKSTNVRLSNNNSEENDKLYQTIALIVGLNQNANLENICDMTIASDATDTTFDNYMSQIIVTDDAKSLFASHMKGKSITDIDDFTKKAKEALILTTVRYPDGWTNIQKVFNTYGSDILGLSSVSSYGSVYQNLAGKSYSTISALVTAYNSYVSSVSSANSGGGSSGGGKAVGISGVIGAPDSVSLDSADTLSMPFTDLNSVPWAYSAISNLYTSGVVSGVSEDKFQPDRYVKREEFVKMLICAMELPLESNGNEFDDVQLGSWYENYVKTAHKNKLVNGMPNNMFGVGQNISRQDMAVMVMNAMVSNGYTIIGHPLEFSDADITSDYAKSAVAELAALGIVAGVDSSNFAPTGVATRAQAAVIINRALGYLR